MAETTADYLRAWARGLYPLEAGVELLCRSFYGRFALATCPWVVWQDTYDEPRQGVWVDADLLHEAATTGPYSGGERRVLLIVASLLSSECQVALVSVLPGLDRHHLDLVLAAIAHASGSHEQGAPSLYPWPQ